MYIPLDTIHEWEVIGLSSPSRTVTCLDELLLDGDILVVASYEPSVEAVPFLERHSVQLGNVMDRYHSTIEANRKEFPRGRVFALPVATQILRELADFIASSRYDYGLFIDHLISFRLSKPVLPLLYHDKLRHGYPMILSGYYDKDTVQAFCDRVGGEFVRKEKRLVE